MARCTKCRFRFELRTVGLLPDCPQCGGATVAIAVSHVEPEEAPAAQPTQKLQIVPTDEE